jgi:predicted NBD/HSP70 family sugar kinase
VRFRAEVGHVAGVDVGSHKVLAKVADLAGAVVASRQVAVPQPSSGTGLLGAVQDALKGALLDAALVPDDVWAIAVGAPGIVDQARGEVLLAPSIPGWAHVSVPLALQSTFSCPVLVDNDTNLAVLGERWRGAAAGSDSLLFVHWGARIGVGVVIDGRPYRGAHAAAGELGFVDVFSGPDEPGGRRRLGAAGSLGPFERQVGAEAILALTRERLGARGARALVQRAGATAPPQPGSPNAGSPRAGSTDAVAAVFAAAATGDPQALDVVDTVARRFARGLAVLLVLLDPSEVVIGGGVSQAGETLLTAIERHLRPRVLAWPTLVLSSLGGDAVAVGGVRRALDHVEPRLHQWTDAV